MKIFLGFFLPLAGVFAFFTGCAQLAVPLPDLNRVISGTVTFAEPATVPAGAQMVIRVLDSTRADGMAKIVAQEVFKVSGPSPIAYKIEFRAEDALVQRGLSIEARIDFEGKAQLFNGNRYAITTANIAGPHEIVVEKMSR